MTNRTILALDLGTKTGWAISTDEVVWWKKNCEYLYGVEDFSNKRFEGGGMRYLRFNNFLEAKLVDIKIDEIYFEEVRRHIGTAAAHAYGGFMATLTNWGERRCIPYQGIPVKTIKKYITGNGNASKQMVIDAVKARGYGVEDNNEADAMALLLYVKQL